MYAKRVGSLILAAGILVAIVHCGGPSQRVVPNQNRSLKAIRKSNPNTNSGQVECRLNILLDYTPADLNPSGPLLWLRGGGWEEAAVLTRFAHLSPNADVAIVLSATNPGGPQNTEYFLEYYRARMPGARLHPVYTRADRSRVGVAASDGELRTQYYDPDVNSESKAAIISQSSLVVITGGYPNYLQHVLPGTKVGDAILSAHARGVPIYTNSASVSLAGNYFSWDVSTRLSAGDSGALGLIEAPVLSHLKEASRYGRDFLYDMWRLVPSVKSQAFGLTAGTIAEARNGMLTVVGPSLQNRLYVYDSRYPAQGSCQYFYLIPGEKFDLSSGALLKN